MFVELKEIQLYIDELIDNKQYNDALANIVIGVHNSFNSEEFRHKHLYYQKFDSQMMEMSKIFQSSYQRSVQANVLIVVTELYQVGGHSRVVEDIVDEVESAIIVLTDLFWSYKKNLNHLNWILDRFKNHTVIVLQQTTLLLKCQELFNLVSRLRPGNIIYMQHHQDPIPFVGTLGYSASRKTLIHHCDHTPSLGNTLDGVAHVDFTDELAHICSEKLQREALVLPLYVADSGRKIFPEFDKINFSVVTSGTSIKFARYGNLSLASIALRVLSLIEGNFFHIGPIDSQWVIDIKCYLAENNINPDRFFSLGAVESLWGAILNLDAHFYIGSAPVGGIRAAIEAQGCGYPVLYFKDEANPEIMKVDSMYASEELGWATVDELIEIIADARHRHSDLSVRSRKFYQSKFSIGKFREALDFIIR